MEEKIEKTSGKNNNIKRLCCILVSVVVVTLAAIIGIRIYNSDANQLQKYLDLGQKYLDEMDYEQAIVAFEQAIEIDPKSVDAYLGMAEAYTGMGEYENSLENFDKLLALDGGNERVADSLDDCLRAYIEALQREGRYDEIAVLAEKYGNLAVEVNFQLVLKDAVEGEGAGVAEPANESPIQVSVRMTDIRADSVFNTEGYGSLQIQSVGEPWIETDNGWTTNDAYILPQAALIDAGGNMVFPYRYTYQRYRVSGDIVSLTESSPYNYSYDQEENTILPIYCRLDGSTVFDTASRDNRIDKTTGEWFTTWYGGPVQDGYALVIGWSHVTFEGFGGEVQSYIMDQGGAITCVLPGEYNEIEEFGEGPSGGWFDTRYSLGWCGEGLFAVFENYYDEEWNFFSDGKGYMDSVGNMVLDLSGRGFTNLWPFHEGLAAVRSESGLIGFIDKTGEVVIPCVYDNANTSFSKDGVCGMEKDGKWGYIDKDGNIVIPFEYDDAYGAGDGLAAVVKDGKCGLVDYSNRVVVPLEYDDISSCEGGTAYAIKDGVLYIISK